MRRNGVRIFERINGTWLELKTARPGRRFREHYKRRNRLAHHGPVHKAVMMLAGGVLIVVGVAGLVLPGPGTLAIAFGGALIATESYRAATAFDVVELRARQAFRSLLRR
jgi:hypothetical protein